MPFPGPSKRQKFHYPPEFWDGLSKIWLEPDALWELNRRKPLCSKISARRVEETTPSICTDCSPAQLDEIKSLAESGGPDMTDLRNYGVPPAMSSNATSESSSDTSAPTETTATTTPSAYSGAFAQHLIDHGVYAHGYQYPEGPRVPKPNNFDEIGQRLGRSRRSFSPSRFSERDLQELQDADAQPCDSVLVSESTRIHKGVGVYAQGGCRFANLAPLTDGTLSAIKPSHFFGSRREELHRQIQQQLGHEIDPSDDDRRPIVPNFFLEARGNDVPVFVAMRKACYAGALAARGMQALQSYGQGGPIYDNNAYTITAAYTGGHLRLYTTHVVDPKGGIVRGEQISRPEYVMTQLGGWSLIGNLQSLQEGVAA